MANKAISELPQAQNVNNQDLFVLEQSGIAKKLPAETFITEQGIIDALAEALDGHGGIQSVTLASVSGRIRTYRITFTDQSATTFQVYDGTSIDRISRTSSSGLDDVYTIFLSDGTTTFFTVHNGADGTVSEAMLNDALKNKAPAITETTESSAIANFTDGADDMVMHNVVAEINPVQSGSGDPSPSNIRPISGWTGCNVTRTGKNLADASTSNRASVYRATTRPIEGNNGLYLSGANGDSDVQSLNVSSWAFSVTKFSFQAVDDINVSLSGNIVNYTENCNGYVCLGYIKDGVFTRLRPSVNFNSLGVTNIQVNNKTIPKGAYLAIQTTPASKATAVTLTQYAEFRDIQVEIGSTTTAYEEYTEPTNVTVDWTTEAGTVYGGTIDVATGLLTVTNGYIASYNGETLPSTWISDRDVYSSGTTPTTGAQVVYALAIPQTYQLTPQDVYTLLGTNNVWADTGNVSVTYPADTKMFIEKLTMPTEDDLVANQAITSGKYFMIGNSLYLALANIASGAQITIGTNAQRVSLADALNTINS